VSAWVLARYRPEEAWRFLQHALESDISDVQGGTTAEGIHLGAMAGTVDIVLRCLTGMRALGPALRFEPALPPEVKQLRFSVHYRGQRVDVDLGEDRIRLGVRPGGAGTVNLLVHGQAVELAPGQERELLLERAP
jgi:alpha,alpha-trehalase